MGRNQRASRYHEVYESWKSDPDAFWDAAARTKADPRWRYYELPCGHGIHAEMPDELKAILYEVIAR